MNHYKNTHVVVGLSGGVDSSVAALLLKQQGYTVSGIFMQNWREDDPHCPVTADLTDARAIAAQLNIPFHYVNFSEQYWQHVFQLFLDEYARGRTPNPDILCNREIKFGVLLDYVKKELNADLLATGHYARLKQIDNEMMLLKGIDQNKDQTYFLSALNQSQLKQSLFPIGDYEKPAIRALAKQHGLITNNKKDSTGICFIGERKFSTFLRDYLWAQPGDIYSLSGDKLGEHQGIMYYTIGQRQGLHIGGHKNYPELPWYVISKDLDNNRLIVAQGENHPALFANSIIISDLHWIGNAPSLPFSGSAKIRYRQRDQSCSLSVMTNEEKKWQVDFTNPVRAVTPGQTIVFYDGEYCLGSGVIESTLDSG